MPCGDTDVIACTLILDLLFLIVHHGTCDPNKPWAKGHHPGWEYWWSGRCFAGRCSVCLWVPLSDTLCMYCKIYKLQNWNHVISAVKPLIDSCVKKYKCVKNAHFKVAQNPLAAGVCCLDQTAAVIFSIWPDTVTNRSVHGLWQRATDRLAEHICCHPNTQKNIHVYTQTHTCYLQQCTYYHINWKKRKWSGKRWKGLSGWQWEKKMEKEAEGE